MNGETLQARIELLERRMNVAIDGGRGYVAYDLLQKKKAAQEELLRLSFLADPAIVRECVNGPG